jgi:hypothetical protein
MKGNEIADIGLEATDLLTARIERVNQTDLVAGFSAVCVAGS